MQTYLQSHLYGYAALPIAMHEDIGTMVQRVGSNSTLSNADGTISTNGYGFWARAERSRTNADSHLSFGGQHIGSTLETTGSRFQAGVVGEVFETREGVLSGGAFIHHKTHEMALFDDDGSRSGDLNVTGYGGGVTLTWKDATGLYIDLVGQITSYDSQVQDAAHIILNDVDGYGVALSGEVGMAFEIAPAIRLIPQGQLSWQNTEIDRFRDNQGVFVSWDDMSGLVGRIGIGFEAGDTAISNGVKAYALANIVHDFNSSGHALVDGQKISYNPSETSWEVAAGLDINLGNDFSIFGEANVGGSFEGFDAQNTIKGTAGLRYRF